MIATTFNGQAVLLITAPPNWAVDVTSDHEILGDETASLSNREARRPHSSTLRTSLSYTTLLADLGLRQAVQRLEGWSGEPILCPFWPGVRRWVDRGTGGFTGGLKIAWKEDWSQWELYTSVEPGWPGAGDNWAPVLWGFLGARGPLLSAKWYAGSLGDLKIAFYDDGPAEYALAPVAGAVAAGPLPPAGYGTAPKLLPFSPNWRGLDDSFTVNLRRSRSGFRRQQTLELYPQAVARVWSLDYQLPSTQEAGQFAAFFRDYGGRGAAVWAPTRVSVAVLTAAIAAADTVLQVEDAGPIAVGDYLALIYADLVIGRRVTAVTSTTVTLSAAVGVDLPQSTMVSPLLLVRQDQLQLRMSWTHTDLAEATLKVRELPTEYSPGADETVGATLGQLPERCYLYDFTRDHGGTLLHNRYTSYERDVTYGGFTWTSADIAHGSIRQGLALDGDRVDLSGQVFAGNPLVTLAALRSEAPVRCTIMSADVSPSAVASGVVILAVGEVDKARLKGSALTSQMSPGGRLLNQQAPRFEVGLQCNHSLFSPGCGQTRAAWVHTALVNGAPSAAYPFTVAIDGLARTTGPTPTYFVDWFAHGWVQIGTPGTANWQRRWILSSTAPASGALTLTLHKAFDPPPADNDPVTLYPGCDLTRESCRAYNASTNPRGKFDNYVNFGGHPEVPASNPSFVKILGAQGGGKK